MQKKINYFSENKGLVLIITLLLLNYGAIWTRGGYADDFAFLAYVEGKDLYSGITQWSFNSRLSQAFLTSFLMKILSGELPGEFHWWIMHGISLGCLVVSLVLFNNILKLLEAPWVTRFVACLFFILYPIKNTTIMWPSTIVVYVIPLTLFLLATCIYLSKAKSNSETFFSLALVWILFLFSIFSVEQLFPLIILIILLRLYLWRAKLSITIFNIIGGLSLVTLFISVNFLGKTADRVSHHTVHGKPIVEHAIQVSIKSFIKLVEFPLRLLLDPYYRSGILTAGSHITFFLSLLLLIGLGWFFIKHERKNDFSSKKGIIFLSAGFVIWFAALSPLMVINYYLPDRVLFIPLIGFSVSVGAFAYILDNYAYSFRYIFMGLLISCGSAFSLVNIYTQNDFAKQWTYENELIDTLLTSQVAIHDEMTINLLNFPTNISPTPKLKDNFTFNGMVNWIFPNRNIEGDSLSNIGDIFKLPISLNNGFQFNNSNFYPKVNHLVLFWTNDEKKFISVSKLNLFPHFTDNSNSSTKLVRENSGTMINGIIEPINKIFSQKYYNIIIPYIITLDEYNIGLLKIVLTKVEQPLKKHRLKVHINKKNGETIPYDMWISNSTDEWTLHAGNFITTIIVNNYSEIASVSVFSNTKHPTNTFTIP